MANESIQGVLRDEAIGATGTGLHVEAWATGEVFDAPVGETTSDAEGRFVIALEPDVHKRLVAARLKAFFRVLRGEETVGDTRDTVHWDPRRPQHVVVPVRLGDQDPKDECEVRGTVVTERGSAAAGLRVVAYDRLLRGESVLGEADTDVDGRYVIGYRRSQLGGKRLADLEVRVFRVAGNNKRVLLARSKVTYQAPPRHVVDLEVSFRDVRRPSEHDRLIAAIAPLLGEVPLADVDADGVVYLANRAGWDPRIVAMGVQAERAAASGVPAAHYYALFRTGAADDPTAAHRLTDERLVQAIEAAAKAGLIADGELLDRTVEIHRSMAGEALRAFVPIGGVSSLDDLLDIRLDDTQKDLFVERLRASEGEPRALWAGLLEAGMDAELVGRLQTDAKLGYLTRYNASVVRQLVDEVGVESSADLVGAGLYEPERWHRLIADSVPPGLSPSAYAAGLAAQVRLAHPTLVTADLVRKQMVEVGSGGVASEVADFLASADDAERRIGARPLRTWDGFDALAPEAQSGALLVERLYQMSPSDASMKALSDLGLRSARAVARYTEAEFLATHGAAFPSALEATLVHRKAQEVHASVLNLATAYLTQRATPPIHVLSGNSVSGNGVPAVGDPEGAPSEEFPAKASLEVLFDNLDFCDCAHCRSVLSPAAYLVELLEFLDLSDIPHAGENPIDVLLERRPDLQHILLSCENTNVALPYIDLVNEVLEHYVVNGDLDDFRGHDTAPGVASADLLVDPQFVEAAAYTPLADHVFPAQLPFDMPLEALRLQFQAWGSTLADGLHLFGVPADVRRERLGINAAELSILTDTTFKELPEYFGEPAGTSIDDLNAAVANAKIFCRRIDVKYLELDRILKTRFVNPGVEIVPAFVALHVGLDVVQSWFDGTLTDQELLDELPEGLDTTPYDGDVLAWLTDHQALLMGLITLSPTEEADPELDECDFGVLELRLSLPDETANALTALEYHRLYRFVRLWRALRRVIDADIETSDELLITFLPIAPADLTLGNLDDTLETTLARLANFTALLGEMGVPKKKRDIWLEVFDLALDSGTRSERLARLTKMGATDFANLAAITGIDPLADDMETDDPSMLAFLQVWRELDDSSLKVDDVDFLLRDGDPAGTRLPTPAQLRADLGRLRASLATVEATLGTPPDADLTIAQTRVALVYDAAVVDRFFGLLGASTTYRASLSTVEEDLPGKITALTPAIGFDPFDDVLTFIGPMTEELRDSLLTAADTLVLADVDVIDAQPALNAYIADLKTAITSLHAAGAGDVAGFSADHPGLGAVLEAALSATDPSTRAMIVLDGILPDLRIRLKATGLRNTLASMLRTDEPTVAALTSGPDVLHAHEDATRGVLDDLLGLEAPVSFDHDAVFEVLVNPPSTDDYLFYVQASPGTQVTLEVNGTTVIPAGAIGPSGEVAGVGSVPLVVAAPVPVELTLAGMPPDSSGTLLWRTDGMAKRAIPSAQLVEAAAADAAGASLLRLRKAVLLAGLLELTPRELVFLASTCPDTAGLLDDLPVLGAPAPASVPAVWAKLAALVSFAALKRDTEPDPDTWVDILENSALGDAAGRERVATIGSWRPADVPQAVAFLGAAGDDLMALGTLRALRRILDYGVATDQTLANLLDWAVADPDAPLIAAIKESVKAALDAASWRETMQSVNDELRNLRRDALVAYVLAHDPPTSEIETADELYEHFLVDVEMDACMQTSRIRLALSTVQLFVTRCLMNLEPTVSPGSIRQDHWAWMKRYRTWEANRKVFLWPENWLEPELRDGKSPFFRELESDLLKADITTELAEDAYLAYLKKLDDVARLEIVGCYLQEGVPGNVDDDILHVIGRTNGKTRQYWYRRFEYGAYWTPWEKVALSIEGDLVMPTMWRNQLYLFWVTALEKPRRGNQDSKGGPLADQTWASRSPIDVELTMNWGELYRGKWISPKSTNMRKPLIIPGLSEFHPEDLLLFSRTERPPESSERLVFSVIYYHDSDVKAFKVVFTSKNASPLTFEDDPDSLLVNNVARFYERLFWERQGDSTLDANSLDVPRTELTLRIAQPASAWKATVDETLLTKKSGFKGWNVRTAMHPVENQWEAPFFYADEHSTFHVKGDEFFQDFRYVEEYVPIAVGKAQIDLSDLYEEVVIRDPKDPIWDPPWKRLVNPNITTVLGEDVSFQLDGESFDAFGLKG